MPYFGWDGPDGRFSRHWLGMSAAGGFPIFWHPPRLAAKLRPLPPGSVLGFLVSCPENWHPGGAAHRGAGFSFDVAPFDPAQDKQDAKPARNELAEPVEPPS
jgi:hypothetical protein